MPEFKSWKDYSDFERRVEKHQRYIRSAEDQEFLQAILETSKHRHTALNKGTILWRAQIGHDWSYEDQIEDYIESPFTPTRMKPLKDRAKEGRSNPKGIPYLYLSTTKDTAMSEVRPWIGSYLSCGSFEIQKDLKLVNLSIYYKKQIGILGYLLNGETLSASEKEKAVWTELDNAFSKPVIAQEDSSEYVATQIIAELFKSNGMDGLAYKSNFGGDTGYNVVLFDLDNASLKSCHLFKATSAEFSFKEDTNPYYISDENDKK